MLILCVLSGNGLRGLSTGLIVKNNAMKKISIILGVLLSLCQYANAQSITVTGNVTSQQGYPIHFAFVQDNLNKNGIFTDSLGDFKLSVNADSKLKVTCKGFRDTVISVN